MSTVIVYTLPNCRKCLLLKEWLEEKKIEFEERRLNTEAQTDLIMENVFDDPPIIKMGDEILTPSSMFKDDLLNGPLIEIFLGLVKTGAE